jgi:hypothetical protein
MRSAETALGIIHDRGKSAVLEDTGEPGAPKWRMPGSGRGGWKSAVNGNSLAAYSTATSTSAAKRPASGSGRA